MVDELGVVEELGVVDDVGSNRSLLPGVESTVEPYDGASDLSAPTADLTLVAMSDCLALSTSSVPLACSAPAVLCTFSLPATLRA